MLFNNKNKLFQIISDTSSENFSLLCELSIDKINIIHPSIDMMYVK